MKTQFKKIIKFIVLIILGAVITLFTAYIPIQGIDLMKMSNPNCDIIAVGLPFSFISAFTDGKPVRPSECYQPLPAIVRTDAVVKRLAGLFGVFLLDAIFWMAVLYAIQFLFGELDKFIRTRNQTKRYV